MAWTLELLEHELQQALNRFVESQAQSVMHARAQAQLYRDYMQKAHDEMARLQAELAEAKQQMDDLNAQK